MDSFGGFTDVNVDIIVKSMLVVCSNPKTGREYNVDLKNVIQTLERYYENKVVFNITFIDPGDHVQPSSNVIKGNFPHDVTGKFDIIWFAGCNFVYGWLFNQKNSIDKFKALLKDDSIFFFTETPSFNRIDKSIYPFVVLDDLKTKELQFILMEHEDIENFYNNFKEIIEPVEGFDYIYRFK